MLSVLFFPGDHDLALIYFAFLKRCGNLIDFHEAIFPAPSVIDVSGNLGDFQFGESRHARHGFIKILSVYDQFTFCSVFHNAKTRPEVFVKIVTYGQWRIQKAQSISVLLVAIAAFHFIQGLPLCEVLLELGVFGGTREENERNDEKPIDYGP